MVSFTKQQERYIAEQVNTGDYQNNSEVIRDALRLHKFYRTQIIKNLQKEIQQGYDSGLSNRSVTDIINAKRTK